MGNENPAQGMGFGRRLSGVPKSLGGTLGWGVGGTPEGVYEGMPLTGTPQPSANHRRCNVRASGDASTLHRGPAQHTRPRPRGGTPRCRPTHP